MLAELTADGEELVQDNDDVAGVSTDEDVEWEQYMRAAEMERPGVALVVDGCNCKNVFLIDTADSTLHADSLRTSE